MDESDDSDDEDINVRLIGRREYKLKPRINLDCWDDVDFVQRFRLKKETVLIVLELIKPALEFDEVRSRYIAPITQLLIALRFYALGSMQITVADFGGVCRASVCRILVRVSEAIARLRPQYVKMPETEEERKAASDAFFQIAAFPRVIGAIDCTHVKIQSPGGDQAESYRNRKGWFSFNVQTVADAKLKIINIVARWPGSTHDQHIFNNSRLQMRLERGDFGNFFIIGDSGYRNTRYLPTPFLTVDSAAKNLYNESQIRTRNVVERSYGVLKRRFPVLSLGMRLKLETVQTIIVACAILHNIAIDNKDEILLEDVPEEENDDEEDAGDDDDNHGMNAREYLVANYFSSLAAEHAIEAIR